MFPDPLHSSSDPSIRVPLFSFQSSIQINVADFQMVNPLHEVRMAIDCGKFHEGFSRGDQSESVIWQTRSYLGLSGETIQGNNQLYRKTNYLTTWTYAL